MPSGPSISRSPADQARNASDLPRAITAGSASRAPCAGERSHQRHRIDLAADRRIAGDDRAGRDFKRQSARGDGQRGGGALRVAQRIACRQRGGAEVCSLKDRGQTSDMRGIIVRRHRPRKRVIQYSGRSTIEPRGRGVLDDPLSRTYDEGCGREIGNTRGKQKNKVRSRDGRWSARSRSSLRK